MEGKPVEQISANLAEDQKVLTKIQIIHGELTNRIKERLKFIKESKEELQLFRSVMSRKEIMDKEEIIRQSEALVKESWEIVMACQQLEVSREKLIEERQRMVAYWKGI